MVTMMTNNDDIFFFFLAVGLFSYILIINEPTKIKWVSMGVFVGIAAAILGMFVPKEANGWLQFGIGVTHLGGAFAILTGRGASWLWKQYLNKRSSQPIINEFAPAIQLIAKGYRDGDIGK